MSRTWNHKRNWFGGVKAAVKSGCKKFHRAEERMALAKIIADPDAADEIVINRYQDCDDRWNYD